MRHLLLGIAVGVVLGGLGTGFAQNQDFYGRPQWGRQVTPPMDAYGRPNFPQPYDSGQGIPTQRQGHNPC